MPRVDAVLFDLDGTLVDSAPDLAAAANVLLQRHGRPPAPYERLRPMVGSGARGMIGVGFGLTPQDAGYFELRDAFHDIYAERLLVDTAVFPAAAEVLDVLDRWPLPWGIVTNKALRFAEPLLQGLAMQGRARTLIGGDSTPHTKPHPEPLLEAARRLGLAPERCVYVGDDARDIQAGQAAGMATLAAAWGYLGSGLPIEQWGADAVLSHPGELLKWLEVA